jgi:hypothetical protein
MSDNSRLAKRVDAIAGPDGFWKRSTRDSFLARATELVARGYSEDDAIELLGDLYDAVSAEYGS